MKTGITTTRKLWNDRLLNYTCKASYLVACMFWAITGAAQDLDPDQVKKMSIEDLMDIEVTLVSRAPQKLSEAASAIQVITSDDIKRSGATSVPEALRLASNLQVAQLNSNAWIISARGFNTIFANKLLVMIDGRTVYTPLYGGVVWSQQNVLLEDVDRIEIVSGPGGTLWGANAVNGVINIITKNTRQAQGLYASVAAGTYMNKHAALRYGGNIGTKISYKVYGQYFDRDATELPNGNKSIDNWKLRQGGFRVDWAASAKTAVSVQGDHYSGKIYTPKTTVLNGENVLARITRVMNDRSDLSLQVYWDRYFYNDAPNSSYDEMKTVDFDFQHRFALAKTHGFVWGAGYRHVKDDANYKGFAVILPQYKNLDLVNLFAQDEMFFADSSIRLTIGTKLLHNVYTDWEWQPNARIAFVKNKNTLWAAVSKVVRTPSRFDRDYYLPGTPQPPTVASVAGGPNFTSEKLIAYELGYRLQPNKVSSFSVAFFYNDYDDLYSVEPLPGTLTYQIQNGSDAETYGIEFSGNYQLHRKWRLRGGYTLLGKELNAKPGHNFNPDYLANDARHRAVLQSIAELGKYFQFDIAARYYGKLPATAATVEVRDYFTFEARLAYTNKWLEVSVVGQNLARKKHAEFGNLQIPRSVYAKLSVRF